MRFSAQSLTDIARDILTAADVSEPRAQQVAERLVTANLCGHDSHGIGMVPKYVEGLQSGGLIPKSDAKIVQDHGQALLVARQRALEQGWDGGGRACERGWWRGKAGVATPQYRREEA